MKRLSARERMMAVVVVGILFVMANLWVLSFLKKQHAQLTGDIAGKQVELSSLQEVLSERDLWNSREAWLAANQPKLANRDQAGVTLLDEVKQAAKANNVQLESPELGSLEAKPGYQSVSVIVQTKSSWNALVTFLNTLQQPQKFIVYEAANLQIEPSDPTLMRGRFRIAKWYAP